MFLLQFAVELRSIAQEGMAEAQAKDVATLDEAPLLLKRHRPPGVVPTAQGVCHELGSLDDSTTTRAPPPVAI